MTSTREISSANNHMTMMNLQGAILPLSSAAMALPPLSIRGDLGVLSTAAARYISEYIVLCQLEIFLLGAFLKMTFVFLVRYAPSLLKSFIKMGPQGALGATKLLRPFSEIVDSLGLKDPFIRNWIDLLAFLLAGVKSNGILSAQMVTIYPQNRNYNLMSITN